MLAFGWLATAWLLSAQHQSFRVRVGAFEVRAGAEDSLSESFVLSGKVVQAENKCRIVITCEPEGGPYSYRAEEDSPGKFDSVDYLIPIRLAGCPYPGVLAFRRRKNWADYEIYVTERDSVTRAFSFSCRDEDAIRWTAVHGTLTGFRTFDRYEAVPERLMRKEHGGRWVWVSTYRWNPKRETFDVTKQSWRRFPGPLVFEPGKEMPPDRISFRWKQ